MVNKPRDLTRDQLKKIKLLLDGAGYSEAKLQSAVRNQTNQDVAASIIDHILRAATDEPLAPFEQRVAYAVLRIYEVITGYQHSANGLSAGQNNWFTK